MPNVLWEVVPSSRRGDGECAVRECTVTEQVLGTAMKSAFEHVARLELIYVVLCTCL